MKGYSIGPLTGSLKPRYRVITTMIGGDAGDYYFPINGIDIFLDLNTLISSMSSSQKFLNSLPFAEDVEKDIISSVLMIVKHWKDFTKRWDDKRIFLIFNDFEMGLLSEQSVLKSYLVPYVNKFTNDRYKQMTYYWNEAIKRVGIILKYIPKTYLIRCDRFDSFVIPNIIDDYSTNERERLVVTGNPLMTNYGYMPNCKVIYSQYRKTGMCQLSDPRMIVQSLTKIDDDIMNTFVKNKVFYNLLNTIIGDYDRGIIGLTQLGMSSFASNLLRAIEKRDIPENPTSIESVLPAVDKAFHDYLRKSYPLVDIDSHSMLIQQSRIEKVKSEMVDLYDIDGLRSLSIDGLNLLELL